MSTSEAPSYNKEQDFSSEMNVNTFGTLNNTCRRYCHRLAATVYYTALYIGFQGLDHAYCSMPQNTNYNYDSSSVQP